MLLSQSWLGKEDYSLERNLQAELPGILNWALKGLQRLTLENNNCFTQLPSASEAIIAMRDLASPVAAFVREQCVKGPDETIAVDELYVAYKKWAENTGHARSSKHVFGRDIRAAVPAVRVERPGPRTTHRVRIYSGIALRSSDDAEDDDNGERLL